MDQSEIKRLQRQAVERVPNAGSGAAQVYPRPPSPARGTPALSSPPQRVGIGAPPTMPSQAQTLRAGQNPSGVPNRVAAQQVFPNQAEALRTGAGNTPSRLGAPQVFPNQAQALRNGRPSAGVPDRVGAQQVFPNQADALRNGQPQSGPPQRVAVPPQAGAPSVNAPLSGTPDSRIAQRLANISGQPYRDPRSAFNRPVNPAPGAAAAASGGGKLAAISKAVTPSMGTLAKTGGALGAITEASRAGYDMLTPGMTGLDQTARVAEGIGRFGLGMGGAVKGAAAGGALGAMTGPLAPVLAPAGALVGGVAGGALGAYAPDMLNAAVNKVSGFFGGPDQNQLPSQKAADLRARNGMPPPGGTPAALPPTGAGAGRGFENPARVNPDATRPVNASAPTVTTGARNVAGGARNVGAGARNVPAAKAPAANPPAAKRTEAKPAEAKTGAPAASTQRSGPSPWDGVAFTSLGDQGGTNGARVYMNDGSILDGDAALQVIDATQAYDAANPLQGGPVEVIRGMTKTTAVPELGYTEMNTANYEAMAANGGIGRLTEAMAQGLVDESAPEAAKLRAALEQQALQNEGQLAQQALQNEGGVAQARVSAGPGFARVALDRDQFKQNRQDAIDGIGGKTDPNRFTVVPGGQEVVDIGGLPTTITRPSRLFNNQTSQYVDENGMPAVGNYKTGQVYTDARGNKATWDGRQFVPVK